MTYPIITKLKKENAELKSENERLKKQASQSLNILTMEANYKGLEIERDLLRTEVEQLKREIKILTNPSDGRCMEISNLRDYRDKLRNELIAARDVLKYYSQGFFDITVGVWRTTGPEKALDQIERIDKLIGGTR